MKTTHVWKRCFPKEPLSQTLYFFSYLFFFRNLCHYLIVESNKEYFCPPTWMRNNSFIFLFLMATQKKIFQSAIKLLQISCTYSLIPLENSEHKEPSDISVLCITAAEHCNYSAISEWIHWRGWRAEKEALSPSAAQRSQSNFPCTPCAPNRRPIPLIDSSSW